MNKDAEQDTILHSASDTSPEIDAATATTNTASTDESMTMVTPDNSSPESSEPSSVEQPTATAPSDAETPPEEEANLTTLNETIAALEQQLIQTTQQLDTIKGQYVRISADFENYRKRSQREKEETEYQAKRNTISSLLSVVDSFERARAHIKPESDGERTIHQSYQGVYKQFVDALKRIGVSAMRPEGEPFDPSFHEAVYREPTSEYLEGTVMEQVLRGYLLGDRVLRHAMVKVAAPQEPAVSSETEAIASPDNDTSPDTPSEE